jgi:hypothetical protein
MSNIPSYAYAAFAECDFWGKDPSDRNGFVTEMTRGVLEYGRVAISAKRLIDSNFANAWTQPAHKKALSKLIRNGRVILVSFDGVPFKGSFVHFDPFHPGPHDFETGRFSLTEWYDDCKLWQSAATELRSKEKAQELLNEIREIGKIEVVCAESQRRDAYLWREVGSFLSKGNVSEGFGLSAQDLIDSYREAFVNLGGKNGGIINLVRSFCDNRPDERAKNIACLFEDKLKEKKTGEGGIETKVRLFESIAQVLETEIEAKMSGGTPIRSDKQNKILSGYLGYLNLSDIPLPRGSLQSCLCCQKRNSAETPMP